MPKRRIKELPSFQRPRERLQELGPQNLTTAELLAILLSSGTRKLNVLSLSRLILKRYPIEVMADTSVNELKKIYGMGEVKAGKIVAALELGKRSLGNGRKTSIRSVEDVVREVNDIRDQNKEHLIALYLNARNELILKQTIAIGTLNQNIIQPRDVFADALKNPCAAVVLIHNHPSGDPEPSDQDIIFTKKLIEAGKLLGIEILDHIVVARDGEASLKASNLI